MPWPANTNAANEIRQMGTGEEDKKVGTDESAYHRH